jgi:glycosyltransferase involved in cell wall biosynthesis
MTPEGCPVTGNGIDPTWFRPPTAAERQDSRRALGITDDQLLVLYLGRIDPTKGIETLLAALSRIGDPRITAIIAGGVSPWMQGGSEYLKRLTLRAPYIAHFLERRDDPRPLIWSADVVAVPSVWEDPLPRVALEAMACGIPVVASRVGGIPEMFQGELDDLLFEASDVDGLATALRRALPELGGNRRWHDVVRANVVGSFTLETTVAAVESLLQSTAYGTVSSPRGAQDPHD